MPLKQRIGIAEAMSVPSELPHAECYYKTHRAIHGIFKFHHRTMFFQVQVFKQHTDDADQSERRTARIEIESENTAVAARNIAKCHHRKVQPDKHERG